MKPEDFRTTSSAPISAATAIDSRIAELEPLFESSFVRRRITEVTMKLTGVFSGLALAALLAVPQAFSAARTATEAMDDGVWAGSVVAQRKDVQEVSMPHPPSGPATPVPFCTPAQPICP